MSQTQIIPLVRDFDELQDRVREAVREGGFSIVDQGFNHAFGTHHQWGAEWQGSDLEFVVLVPEKGDDEPFTIKRTVGGCDGEHRGRCKPCCEEYEVELKATIEYLRPVLDAAFQVKVTIEQR